MNDGENNYKKYLEDIKNLYKIRYWCKDSNSKFDKKLQLFHELC